MWTFNGTIVIVKTYLRIAATVFLIVALAHSARLIEGSAVVVGDWHLPMWVSAVGVLLAGVLSFLGFTYANKAP